VRITASTLLVLDTETTGVDTAADRVVEVGGAYLVGGEPAPTFRSLVNPGQPIPAEASEIHGITDEAVAAAPTFAQLAPRLRHHVDGAWAREHFLGDPVLVGYNALHFDVPILDAELLRAGACWWLAGRPTLDPILFVKAWQRGESGKLVHTCARFGVQLVDAHTAAADARATGALLVAMARAGFIPDDVDEALALQAWILPKLAAEDALWRYHLYRDRGDGRLRIGFGRYKGRLLTGVPTRYLDIVLGFDDLPREVRWEVSMVRNGRRR